MRGNLNLRLIKLFATSPLRFEPSCVLVEFIISQKKVRTMKSAVGEGWFLIRKIMEIIIEALEGADGRVARAGTSGFPHLLRLSLVPVRKLSARVCCLPLTLHLDWSQAQNWSQRHLVVMTVTPWDRSEQG